MTKQELIDNGYVEGKKSFDFCVKQIFEDFKFENVYKAMKALDWSWYLGSNVLEDNRLKNKEGIPTISTLKNEALRLLKIAYEKEITTGSGGFWASWDNGELCLTFVLEEASIS